MSTIYPQPMKNASKTGMNKVIESYPQRLLIVGDKWKKKRLN
ncbi:hypothetical protein [Limosilactobacillus equigenerosi]|nr:hypothetical protein [Limosilactobacillus equigenerosi]